MRKFTKIWAKSEEKLAKAVVLYPDSNFVLYRDKNRTEGNTVTADEMLNFFKKGLLLVDGGEIGMIRPYAAMMAPVEDGGFCIAQVLVVVPGEESPEAIMVYSGEFSNTL